MQYEFITFSGMVVLGSRGTSIENKGFFFLKVRKFKKMAVFDIQGHVLLILNNYSISLDNCGITWFEVLDS